MGERKGEGEGGLDGEWQLDVWRRRISASCESVVHVVSHLELHLNQHGLCGSREEEDDDIAMTTHVAHIMHNCDERNSTDRRLDIELCTGTYYIVHEDHNKSVSARVSCLHELTFAWSSSRSLAPFASCKFSSCHAATGSMPMYL